MLQQARVTGEQLIDFTIASRRRVLARQLHCRVIALAVDTQHRLECRNRLLGMLGRFFHHSQQEQAVRMLLVPLQYALSAQINGRPVLLGGCPPAKLRFSISVRIRLI